MRQGVLWKVKGRGWFWNSVLMCAEQSPWLRPWVWWLGWQLLTKVSVWFAVDSSNFSFRFSAFSPFSAYFRDTHSRKSLRTGPFDLTYKKYKVIGEKKISQPSPQKLHSSNQCIYTGILFLCIYNQTKWGKKCSGKKYNFLLSLFSRQ